MFRIIITILFVIVYCNLYAQTTVAGYVYEDTNENGKKERRENGLPDVAVSNGEDVVLTDKKGRYELTVGKDNPVFVIKPSGYKILVDDNNLPQYYYLHKPEGSPKLKYAGVEPTAKSPKSLDFGLIPADESEQFTTLVFGDPQPYTEKQVDFFDRGVVNEVEGIEGVEFGISLGDLVGDDLTLFNPYIQSVRKVGIPWYNVIGNHDMNYDVKEDKLSDETYEAHFGPANFAFNYSKVHFIILDDILYPDPRDGKGYWGGFRADQLKFIENNLKYVPKDHLIVLAAHIPFSSGFNEENRSKLFKLLKDFPHTLSLSAHTHTQRQDFFTRDNEWLQDKPHHHYNVGTTSGSWYGGELDETGIPYSTMRDGTPKGYAFIHFDGNDYAIDYKVANKPANYQMRIFAPKVVPHKERTSAGIYVNFFMGREGDDVIYRIDEGDWKKMSYHNDYDPYYLHLLHKYDFSEELLSGKRLPNPVRSTHLWKGRIETNLNPGRHIIKVKAKDMFGRVFTQKSTYRIAVPKSVQ